jgi:protease-4
MEFWSFWLRNIAAEASRTAAEAAGRLLMKRVLGYRTVWLALGLLAVMLLPAPALAAKKIVRVLLNTRVLEAPAEQFNLAVLFNPVQPKTLLHWERLIRRAADDSEIAGMALIIAEPQIKLAQVEELTAALKAFRDKGKKVYCYLDEGGNASYALACAADHITLADMSQLDITGIYATSVFFKGLMDKIGLQADMLHCGAYKSAVEPFTRTEPSPEARENMNWLLDGIYQSWLQLMANGRHLDLEQIKTAVNSAPLRADQALQLNLVDDVSSFAGFRERLYKEYGRDVEVVKKLKKSSSEEVTSTDLFSLWSQFMGKLMEGAETSKQPGVAVLYIDGGITMGRSEPDLFSIGQNAGSTTIRAAFDKARKNENVKAVVVRVDSPGGSALASDIMWQAARRTAEEKPLVVSMGSVAGSGGYYVSVPGQTIFADSATITGSIGVLGGKLVWRDLLSDKLGITTAEYPRGEHAGLMSPQRNWSDSERAFMQNYIEQVYVQFKDRVKESRGDRLKTELEDIAGGRVYTGEQAVKLGLVDKIGGLSDAIRFVAKKAGLGDKYEIYIYPEQKDVFQELMAALTGEERKDDWEIAETAFDLDEPLLRSHDRSLELNHPLVRALLPLLQRVSPQQAEALATGLRNLLIIGDEHVGCFMPAIVEPH